MIPLVDVPKDMILPSTTKLRGANGSDIVCYGELSTNLVIPKLNRDFKIKFVIADTKPILGADFLTTFGLILDMTKRKICDPLTNRFAILDQRSSNCVTSITSSDNDNFLAKTYPELTDRPDYTRIPSSEVYHAILTTGPPKFSRPRMLPPGKLEIAKSEFDKLLDLGIIRPSSSPWSSPLHMVKKPDGTWRPCGDYRRVNQVTIPDRYPIPNLQSFHHRLGGACVFSKIDLVKAYHFIPVRPEDIEKTAICTPFGSFEYLRMPFGLRNAAGTFQRFIDSHIRDIDCCIAYLDDILIFSKDQTSHKQHLKMVLDRLQTVGLKVNDRKCEFNKRQIEFLGHQVDEHGIRPPESRVQALKNLNPPRDEKELVRYLGMFGFYQRCIPHFAELVTPLRNLRKGKSFQWDDTHTKAFLELKRSLEEATYLAFPSKIGHLTITADASNEAIGACLNQLQEGEVKPLSFFSRKLSPGEKRTSTFDKELLAIFAAVKRWRDLIDPGNLTIFTDHKPIIGAFHKDKQRFSDKQQRQLSFISEFTSDIIHVAGKDNVVADSFSRVAAIEAAEEISNCDLPAIAREQAKNRDQYADYKQFDIGLESIPLFCEVSYPNPRPVVPEALRRSIFQSLHGLCHAGVKATARMITSRYFWRDVKKDAQLWCQECLQCQSAKVGIHTKKPIKDLPVPTQRFTNVHMDIVGPLEQPDVAAPHKPRYLLTIIDAWTRWLEVIPIADISSLTVCHVFMYAWVARFGPPLTLTTDRGTQFCSELTERLNELLGIHHIRTTAFNPRANGMIERAHRSLKASLKARGRNWLTQLPIILLGLRMRPDEDGTSAFSRVTGEQPLVPHILPANFSLTQLAIELHKLPFNLKLTRKAQRDVHLPEVLKNCSHVWLRIDRIRRPLEAPYQGPFPVVARQEDTFTILIKDKKHVVSIDRVKPAVLPQNYGEKKPLKSAETEKDGMLPPNEAPVVGKEEVKETETTEIPSKGQDTTEGKVSRSGRRIQFRDRPEYIFY